MRIALIASGCALLVACGGPESSQANNAQANIGNDASPPPTANSTTNSMVLLSVPKDKLLKVMHERHEGMETIGKNFKVLRRELTGSSPDLGAVRSSSATVAKLASNASGWFPQGTGPELGKTGAKSEIWKNPQDFAAKLRDFQGAAKAFHTAAAANDVGATKDRFAD